MVKHRGNHKISYPRNLLPLRYFLVKILKNPYTSTCLNLNYVTTKQKPKMQRLQPWWNLSKLVNNTLTSLAFVIFQLHNPPLFLLSGKRFSEIPVRSIWVISFYLGESFAWDISKNVSSNNLNTINLKLFRNHGGICKFEKKFKKYSG